jgi:purine-binding chemotaxis protein CheW
MRPLPVEFVASAPAFVSGVTLVRGAPVPVVDLAALLHINSASQPTRFVTVRTGRRSVVLAVEVVVGIRSLDSTLLSDLPPLLQEAPEDFVTALGGLDSELLLVLQTACLVPEARWPAVEPGRLH